MRKKFKSLLVTGIVAVSVYGMFQGVYTKDATDDLSVLTLANVEALANDEGCGGLAKLSDPIWQVTVEIGGGDVIFPKIICTTGGCYKCSSV